MHTEPRLHRPFGLPLLAALVCSIGLAVGVAHAGPSGSWERISPPGQTGGAAVFAPAHQLMYVLGGDGTSIVHTVPAGNPPVEWGDLAATGAPPSARQYAALLYDPTNDRLLVFGGADYSGNKLNDLWQLTLTGTPTWSRLTVTGDVPAPRADFGACFNDSRGTLFVFGGVGSSGSLLPNHSFQVDLSQPSPEWTEWTPFGDTPTALSGLSLCDDPNHDGMVLFGGTNGADQSEAYTMSYGSHEWTHVVPTGDVPPPTNHALGVWDSDVDLLFVWGGSGGDDNMRSLSPASGTWTIEPNTNWQPGPVGHTHPVGVWVAGTPQFLVLDGDDSNQLFSFSYYPATGSYWQNWADPGVADETRYGASFVYDRADDMALLFGGKNMYGTTLSSAWTYSFASPKGWYNSWFHVIADGTIPNVSRHAAVWDQKHRRMLVFGGMNQGYVPQNAVYANQDTMWGNYWTQLVPAGTPPTPRYGTSAIYDPVGDRMLVFGGVDISGSARGDLWQLALSGTPTWSRLVAPGGPAGREDHTAIYDELHHRMIVFGGYDSLAGVVNDTWALNLPALTWTHVAPTGTPAPVRLQHTAVYDSRRCRMLVFGGDVAFGADERDTWELNLVPNPPVWTHLTPTVAVTGLPMKRFQHAAVYDSTGDRMLVYGGLYPAPSGFGNDYPLKDLWSLQFDFTGGVAGVAPSQSVAEFAIGLPSPNPAHGATRLSYTLGHEAHVRAEIYDLAGRRIVTLENGMRAAGPHELSWSGRSASGSMAVSGLYFYRIEAAGRAVTQKVLVVR